MCICPGQNDTLNELMAYRLSENWLIYLYLTLTPGGRLRFLRFSKTLAQYRSSTTEYQDYQLSCKPKVFLSAIDILVGNNQGPAVRLEVSVTHDLVGLDYIRCLGAWVLLVQGLAVPNLGKCRYYYTCNRFVCNKLAELGSSAIL